MALHTAHLYRLNFCCSSEMFLHQSINKNVLHAAFERNNCRLEYDIFECLSSECHVFVLSFLVFLVLF